jgi:type VI secretion system secreted protein VgrG
LEGDLDRPIITGRVYNGDNRPPFALPANQTQSGVKSHSTKGCGQNNFNAIRFEDKKGSEQVDLQAEKDLDSLVKNDETRDVKHDQTITIGNDRAKTVVRNETVLVQGCRTEAVDKQEDITIGESRTVDVGADESISIGGNRTEEVAKAAKSRRTDIEVIMAIPRGQLFFRLSEGTGTIVIHQRVKDALDAAGFKTLRFEPL